MRRIRIIPKIILAFMILPVVAFSQPVKIGIVKDASGSEFELLAKHVKAETEALTRAGEGAVFKELSADWQPGKVHENLQAFMNDPDVDIVVTLGILSSEAAARLPEYPKPVIAATVLDPQLQHLPARSDKSSGTNNFSWIESFIRLKSDVLSFSRIFDFNRLAVIIPQEIYNEFPVITQVLTQDTDEFDITFVPVEKNEISLEELPAETGAALVFPLIQHAQAEIEELFSELNRLYIPSLAINGTSYLELGATITFTPRFSFQQVARQVALRILKVSEGTNLSEIPIITEEKLRTPVVNMESIRRTDKFPQWAMLENAVLLNIEKIPGEELSLHRAVAQALENNLQGRITDQDLLMAQKDIRIARANVLPQVEVSGTGVQLSKNLVEASMGQQGEFTITGSVSLKQVIYSEAAFANIAIKKLVAENVKQSNMQTTLGIVLDVSKAYLSLRFAKNNLQIKNENVYATLQNLELAKAREESGEGSVSDVNRWTSELSLNKMDLNDAEAGYKAAMYRLNELLNLPIGNTVATPDPADIGDTIVLNQDILDLFFGDPKLTEKYSAFLIDEMYAHSPELQQIETAAKIIDRQKTMQIRQRFLPEVALIAGADQAFVREGTIRNPELPVPPPPDDVTWNVGVRLSIPIIEGGRKKTEIQRTAIEQDKIMWQKEELLNSLETGIRSNVQFLQTSYRELELSENAAEAAEDNFKLIQDAYSQGVVNVAQLIDAQNVMIRTKHFALSARYQYILDFIKTERLQGKFSFLDDKTEQALYRNRLLNYLTEEE